MKKIIRTLERNEVWKLKKCIQELAEHHNTVSVNFKGNFPRRPYEVILESFETSLKNGTSKIAVVEENEQIAVKVVDGNEAIHLYEKYGFKMNAHILVHD